LRVGRLLRDAVRLVLRKPVTMGYPLRREGDRVASYARVPVYDPQLCVGCMLCAKFCPSGAITPVGRRVSFEMSRCVYCGQCADVCPTKAIRAGERPIA